MLSAIYEKIQQIYASMGSGTDLTTVNTNTGSTATNTSAISTNIGAKADSTASSDTGSFSVIAFLKRLLDRFTTFQFIENDRLVTKSVSLSTGSETTILDAVADRYIHLKDLIINNSSASAVVVSIRSATGGSVIFKLTVPANDHTGIASVRLKQAAVNNNWTIQQSGTSNLDIYACGVTYS